MSFNYQTGLKSTENPNNQVLLPGVFVLTGMPLTEAAQATTDTLAPATFAMNGEPLTERIPFDVLSPAAFDLSGEAVNEYVGVVSNWEWLKWSGSTFETTPNLSLGPLGVAGSSADVLHPPSTVIVFVTCRGNAALLQNPNGNVVSVTATGIDSGRSIVWSQALTRDCFAANPVDAYGPNCFIYRFENTQTTPAGGTVNYVVTFNKPQYYAISVTEFVNVKPNGFLGFSWGVVSGNGVQINASNRQTASSTMGLVLLHGGYGAAFTQFTGAGSPTPPNGFFAVNFEATHTTNAGIDCAIVNLSTIGPWNGAGIVWPDVWNVTQGGAVGLIGMWEGPL